MKIKSIKQVPFSGKVYNFHCLPDETYYSEGVLVHNCYKNNNSNPPTNMTLETFKTILNKFPKYNGHHFLTQIAFGITGVQTNPDFIPMMKHARSEGVIPNFTLSGFDFTLEFADQLPGLVGACAVSAYETNKNVCYDTVKMLTDRGIDQTNIHLCIFRENLDFVYEVLNDAKTDPRLAKLNAIVLLSLKQKGRGVVFTPLTQEEFSKLANYALDTKQRIGFDSCSVPKLLKAIENRESKEKEQLTQMIEPCEICSFSSYIDVNGIFHGCSFLEKVATPQNVLTSDSFMDIWNSPITKEMRNKLMCNNRRCPYFDV